MHEFQSNFAEWNRQDKKEYIVCDYTFSKNKLTFSGKKKIDDYLGTGVRG